MVNKLWFLANNRPNFRFSYGALEPFFLEKAHLVSKIVQQWLEES